MANICQIWYHVRQSNTLEKYWKIPRHRKWYIIYLIKWPCLCCMSIDQVASRPLVYLSVKYLNTTTPQVVPSGGPAECSVHNEHTYERETHTHTQKHTHTHTHTHIHTHTHTHIHQIRGGSLKDEIFGFLLINL